MTKTNAHYRFSVLINRTERLIQLGGIGINQDVEKFREILDKVKDVKGKPGKHPKDYKPDLNIEKIEGSTDVNLTFDERTGYIIKKAIEQGVVNTEELHNHLYSIYLVYVWGAFETYLVMMFEELFKRKVDMLKSNETITYNELVENKNDIISFLIDKELDKIGHFSLEKYIDYLSKKVNFKVTNEEKSSLEKIYLLRNIIAHNTGTVPKRLISKIPKSLKVKDSELFVSKKFLESETQTIKNLVNKIESHIEKKFK